MTTGKAKIEKSSLVTLCKIGYELNCLKEMQEVAYSSKVAKNIRITKSQTFKIVEDLNKLGLIDLKKEGIIMKITIKDQKFVNSLNYLHKVLKNNGRI